MFKRICRAKAETRTVLIITNGFTRIDTSARNITSGKKWENINEIMIERGKNPKSMHFMVVATNVTGIYSRVKVKIVRNMTKRAKFNEDKLLAWDGRETTFWAAVSTGYH